MTVADPKAAMLALMVVAKEHGATTPDEVMRLLLMVAAIAAVHAGAEQTFYGLAVDVVPMARELVARHR